MILDSKYMACLKTASEGILRYSRSEDFMKWVVEALFLHLKPWHVSIALYDAAHNRFNIRYSAGKKAMPKGLVALNEDNPFVRNFPHKKINEDGCHIFDEPVNFRDFETAPEDLKEDVRRHGVEVCVKIDTVDRLHGYLFVGPREDGGLYTPEDLLYFQTLAHHIAVEITKEEFYLSANVDPLTGALNRNLLKFKFQDAIQKAYDSKEWLAIVIADLDDFKKINDTYGHLVGDEVLRIASELFRSGIRQSDLLFRYGGEEFVMLFGMKSRVPTKKLLPDEFQGGVLNLLERLREKISCRPLQVLSYHFSISVSFGVHFYDGSELGKPDTIIGRADEALYISKKTGKNKVSVYLPK